MAATRQLATLLPGDPGLCAGARDGLIQHPAPRPRYDAGPALVCSASTQGSGEMWRSSNLSGTPASHSVGSPSRIMPPPAEALRTTSGPLRCVNVSLADRAGSVPAAGAPPCGKVDVAGHGRPDVHDHHTGPGWLLVHAPASTPVLVDAVLRGDKPAMLNPALQDTVELAPAFWPNCSAQPAWRGNTTP